MNGNNIIVYQQNGTSWTAIAATQSDELQVEGETIEISSATDSDWVHRIAGRKNWSLNVNWLVTEVADIRKVLTVNTRVKVRIGGRSFSSSSGLEGFAFVTLAKLSAPNRALAKGAFSLKGDGPLT